MSITKTKYFLIVFLFILTTVLKADPPEPDEGFRWVLVPTLSDEFSGTELDKTKWRDFFVGWKGRAPAKFEPSSISVQDGDMRIKSGVLSPVDGNYTIAGGAVQTLNREGHFGYYECRVRSSRIVMSTTFWLSNSKKSIEGPTKLSGDCDKDKWSQELDIIESIGGVFNGSSKFRTDMNFNTHYRYVDCNGAPEKFYSAGNNAVEGNGTQAPNSKLSSESWQDYHVFGCHWKDAVEFDFYADDNFAGKVFANTSVVNNPFSDPMGINLVNETYTWAQPYPTSTQLNNDEINTAYYDWVRSYKLIPVDEVFDAASSGFEIYDEDVTLEGKPEPSENKTVYKVKGLYKINTNRVINFQLKSDDGVLTDDSYSVLAGFGKQTFDLNFSEQPESGVYELVTSIKTNEGEILKSSSRNFRIDGVGSVTSFENEISIAHVELYPNPVSNKLTIKNAQGNSQYSILSLQGSVISSGLIKNEQINTEFLSPGVYILKLENSSHRFFKK